LAYPDYSEVFEIYTDASSKQLGAVITQKNRPIAFFSRKLSVAHHKYSVTKIELLRSSVGNILQLDSPLRNANTVSPKLNY
jgi:hypothetical protein